MKYASFSVSLGISVLIPIFLISACVVDSGRTSNQRGAPNRLAGQGSYDLSAAVSGLKSRQLSKRAVYSGSKKITEPVASFYTDIPDCSEGPFLLRDLPVEEVRISNHEKSTVSDLLSVMGYTVVRSGSADSEALAYDCTQLPIIVSVSVSGSSKAAGLGDYGLADQQGEGYEEYPSEEGSPQVEALPDSSNAGEVDSLLAYYHPQKESEYQKLKWLIKNKLDTPSAQVYIETMVLEVREEDSDEFGVQFSKGDSEANTLLSLGALDVGLNTFGWIKDTFTDPLTGENVFVPGTGKRLQLKALIDEGKAEVLSRPSVLAISNRQAVIQIVDVLQTAELSSTLTEGGNLEISAYEFEPLLLGITLNLLPRVSADRQWLSLAIDATVESEDDENSGQVFAPTNAGGRVLLAEKQGSSKKNVRTFARIPDRTPIIIGGLVSKVIEERESRVPILGSIPFLGRLFASTDDEVQKREIIIVLTPYILDEDGIGIASNQPKADVTNRLSDSILFENKYRLSNEDLFDMSFFDSDESYQSYREKALLLLQKFPSLKNKDPFTQFANNKVPGERHLINKTIFDLVSRTNLNKKLDLSKIVLLGDSDEHSYKSLKDVAKSAEKTGLILMEADRGVEQKKGKSVSFEGADRDFIIIRNAADIERLSVAITASDIITLNGGYKGLQLNNMHSGKQLKVPNYRAIKEQSLPITALEIYQDAKGYYEAMLRDVDKSYAVVDHYQRTYKANIE